MIQDYQNREGFSATGALKLHKEPLKESPELLAKAFILKYEKRVDFLCLRETNKDILFLVLMLLKR